MKKYENPEIELMNVTRDVITTSVTLDEDPTPIDGYDAYGRDIFSLIP